MSSVDYVLYKRQQALFNLATLAHLQSSFLLEVREDRCFGEAKWLSLGNIQISPAMWRMEESGLERWRYAIECGQFAWKVPTQEELLGEYQQILQDYPDPDAVADKGKKDEAIRQSERANQVIIEAVQDMTRRLCLILPAFDTDLLTLLPFRRPATLVSDTSGVLQGGLDFAVRFLYPMARIKVPIVVSLEIRNMADRFLTMRRANRGAKFKHLHEHIKSQAGDRALMRLEFSDVEVERRLLNTDPFRMIYTKDMEQDVQNLNLSEVQRSFADRLIFETAKEYMAHISPGQPLYILTSDQGLARTALAEGFNPMYFEARKVGKPFGRTLTGTLYHPLNAGLYTVSLIDVLWEAATCFGSARLRWEDGKGELCAVALGENIVWFPYHAKEDLLWCSFKTPAIQTPPGIAENIDGAETTLLPAVEVTSRSADAPNSLRIQRTETTKTGATSGGGAYVISVPKLISLVRDLVRNSVLSRQQVISALGVNSIGSYDQYRRFLLTGNLIAQTGENIEKRESLDRLWQGLTELNLEQLRDCLLQVPSFASFLEYIRTEGNQSDWVKHSFTEKRSATGAYRSLAEISASALAIAEEGIFITDNKPDIRSFAAQALEVYNQLQPTEIGVLTGKWLEAMAREKNIHPIVVRKSLGEAFEARLLNRSYSGATPEQGFNSHTLDVLEIQEGVPVISRYNLYQGNFLSTERASVHIRLESGTP